MSLSISKMFFFLSSANGHYWMYQNMNIEINIADSAIECPIQDLEQGRIILPVTNVKAPLNWLRFSNLPEDTSAVS